MADGIDSDDSDKDRYQPEGADSEDMDESSGDDEPESEEELEVVDKASSKKGKRAKPGRQEIAAARRTVPTTGSKSALAAAKKRERSARSVPCKPCLDHLLTILLHKSEVLNLMPFQPKELKRRTNPLRAFVLDGIPFPKEHRSPLPISRTVKTMPHQCSMEAWLAMMKMMESNGWQS